MHDVGHLTIELVWALQTVSVKTRKVGSGGLSGLQETKQTCQLNTMCDVFRFSVHVKHVRKSIPRKIKGCEYGLCNAARAILQVSKSMMGL